MENPRLTDEQDEQDDVYGRDGDGRTNEAQSSLATNAREDIDADVAPSERDAEKHYAYSPALDAAPVDTNALERSDARRDPQPPPHTEAPVDRFEHVRQAERLPAPRKARLGGDFSKIPLPAPNSTGPELLEYWKKAHRAGVPVTARDLESYDDLVRDGIGKSVLVNARNDRASSPGLRRMAQTFAAQNPNDVKRTLDDNAFGAMRMQDAREEVGAATLRADLDPDSVAAEPQRFAQNMKRLVNLAPLPKDASPSMVSAYRSAARGVGVRLKMDHIEEHQSGDASIFRGEDEPTPFGVTVLKELELPVGQRKLFETDAMAWADTLRARQPLPVQRTMPPESATQDATDTAEPQQTPYGFSPPLPGDVDAELPVERESRGVSANDRPAQREAPGRMTRFAPVGAAFGAHQSIVLGEHDELLARSTAVSGNQPVSQLAQRFKPTETQLSRKGPAPLPPHHR